MTANKCSARVWSGGSASGHQCRRAGTHEEGGRLYCQQHAPGAVQAREDARAARRKAEGDERQRLREINARATALRERSLEAIKPIADGHKDPRQLARDVLGEEPAR